MKIAGSERVSAMQSCSLGSDDHKCNINIGYNFQLQRVSHTAGSGQSMFVGFGASGEGQAAQAFVRKPDMPTILWLADFVDQHGSFSASTAYEASSSILVERRPTLTMPPLE